MKRDESGNPSDARNEWSLACSRASRAASEISGYADIGMKTEAIWGIATPRVTALNTSYPQSAKTLNFFVATSALRLLTAKPKDFAFPSSEMQSSRVVPLAAAPQTPQCSIPQRAITAVRSQRFREAS